MPQDDLSVRIQSARQLLAAKSIPEALSALTELRRDYPNNPDILVLLGAAHADGGSLGEAIECLNGAIAMRPNARTYYNLAMVFRQKGDVDQARSALGSALGHEPGYERATQMLTEIEQANRTQYAAPAPMPQHFSAPQTGQPSQPQAPTHIAQTDSPHYGASAYSRTPPSAGPLPIQPMTARRQWWKVILGGILVGVPFLAIWLSWASVFAAMLGGVPGLLLGLLIGFALTAGLTKWLADSAGAYETHHWLAMVFLTGLIPSLLMMKGFDLIAAGWYHIEQ